MKRKNKKIILIFLFVIFLGIVSPFQNVARAEAGMFDVIFSPLGALANEIGKFFLGLIVAIPVTLLETAQNLLSAVISPDFLSISMTGPDNVVVSYGWAITRDLANICLLLGLVVIGLGIILGLEEYQAKKTLPRLIAVALLINFTLVICGFILDFANLLMNYLLGAGSLGKGLAHEIQNGVSELGEQDLLKSLGLVITLYIFSIVAFIVYLLYALLFIARYVYLWILIIVSPIAFASKVFPSLSQSKQFFPSFFHWDEWWKNFIQWATIGIYAAFFIALANRLMVAMASGDIISTKLSALGALFSYLFPLALLLIGYFSILETGGSVPGYKKVIGYGKAAAIGAGAVAAGAAAGATLGAIKKDEKGVRGGLGGAWKGATTSGGREEGLMAARRLIEKVPLASRVVGGPGSADRDREEKIEKARAEIKKIPKSPAGAIALQRRMSTWEVTQGDYYNRMATMEALAERSAPDDSKTQNIIKQYAPEYQKRGYDPDNILKFRPDQAENFYDSRGKAMTVEDATKRIEPEDAPKIRKEAYIINSSMAPEEKERKHKVAAAIFGDERHVNNIQRRVKRKDRLELIKTALDAQASARVSNNPLPPDTVSRIRKTRRAPEWK